MEIEEEVGLLLRQKSLTLSVAESCTGGLVGDMITNISGSSEYFLGGIIAYDNTIKANILGVSEKVLDTLGAVSAEAAKEMAQNIREKCNTDIGLSITGIAGPTGGTKEKPVGLVFIGIATQDEVSAKQFLWHGNRIENKQQSAHAALEIVKNYLQHIS